MSEIWNLGAICRCCHSDGHFKSLKRTYVVDNDVEIYSSMLRDTFGIIIDPPAADISYSICDRCISDLRKATLFKKQVLICEAKFEEYCKNEESLQLHDDIKIEVESIGGDYDHGDDFIGNNYEDTDDNKYFKVKDEYKTDKKERIDGIKAEDATPNNKVEILIDTKKTFNIKSRKNKKTGKNRPPKPHLDLIVKLENGRFSCKSCGGIYKSDNSIRSHIMLKHGTSFRCSHCDAEFKTLKEKYAHLSIHKPDRLKSCKFCNKTYYNKYDFDLHVNTHTRKRIYVCDHCDKQFMHKRSLVSHIKVLHLGFPKPKVMCEICGHSFNDVTNMRIHVQTVHEKLRLFKCHLCPKDFTAKKHLTVHIRKHTGERPYACESCERAYTSTQELTRHVSERHSGKTTVFTCKLCSLQFPNRGLLRKHSKGHSGSKPLICNLCNKDFACKYSLGRHIAAHVDEKKFQCDICLKKFRQSSSMIRHKGRFHSGKVVVKRQCHLCKKKVSDLEKHIETHNNKPFGCHFCPKRYPLRNALNRHIANIHFGRKAHACDMCDQKYVHPRSLRNHKLKVHKVESKVEVDTDELVEEYVDTYMLDKKDSLDVKLDLSN